MVAMQTLRAQLEPRALGGAMLRAGRSFAEHGCSTHAAALAFYFLMSLFPFLILLASLMAMLPFPHLFDHILKLLGEVAPHDAIRVIDRVLRDTLKTNRAILSAGIVGTLWAASSGFNALTGALNIAYGVRETRPLWKRRASALVITCLVGTMLIAGMAAVILGPEFGFWISLRLGVKPVFAFVWPILRWWLVLGFTIASVELLYFIGPNVRQRFMRQIPGATFAVVAWITASSLLGMYVRSYGHYNKTYGVLGGVIILLLWLYLSASAVLAGAELNAELARRFPVLEAKAAVTPGD